MITIEVRGLPAPQGSKRHVGRGIMVESSKAVGPWREAVRAETQRMMAAHPFVGAVKVEITFGLGRPKGHYGTGKNVGKVRDSAPWYPQGRPDLDKLARAVLDGLTAGGAWVDDAQVVCLTARKVYDSPGCRINIEGVGSER
jgi:Holliday junction resolvase RusA-like endonuclease